MPSLKSGTWREVDFQQWGELRIGEALPLASLFFGPNLDLFPIWYRSHSKLLKVWVSLPLSEVSTAHDSDLRGIWRVASPLLCRDFFIFFHSTTQSLIVVSSAETLGPIRNMCWLSDLS